MIKLWTYTSGTTRGSNVHCRYL